MINEMILYEIVAIQLNSISACGKLIATQKISGGDASMGNTRSHTEHE